VLKVGLEKYENTGREARKAWLGIEVQVLTRDIVEQLKLGTVRGVRITRVYTGTPAEQEGLKVGDFITAIEGEPIAVSRPEESEIFFSMVRQYPVNSEIGLSVMRDGVQRTLKVHTALSPELARETKKYRDDNFDFEARELTSLEKKEKRDILGAVVTDVDEGGWAALAHLAVGDTITEVNGKPVADVGALEALMKALAKEKAKRAVLKVNRKIHTLYVELEANW